MSKNLTYKWKKRREIQYKLFLKFLKKENLYKEFRRVVKKSPSLTSYFNGNMYEYIFILYDYDSTIHNRYNFWNLERKWSVIVDNYKRIKKSNYIIYGK